jgi:hypothetical protein
MERDSEYEWPSELLKTMGGPCKMAIKHREERQKRVVAEWVTQGHSVGSNRRI